jgi:hypothetical protein
MKKSSIQCVALLAVAGMACSMAAAQSSESHSSPTKSDARATPKKYRVLTNHEVINPERVWLNGVEVPFTLGDGSAMDAVTVAYDNISTGPFLADTVRHNRMLDEVTFSQTAEVLGIRPSWATAPTVSSIATVAVVVEFQFFGTFNAGATPVNSGPASNIFRVQYGIPAGGYAANTVYTGAGFIIGSFGTLGPTVSSGAMDVRILRADILGPHPDYDPAIDQGGVLVGSSADGVYADANGNTIYESGEILTLAGTNNNIRMAIQGRIATPANTGACCLTDPAGGKSCVILTQAKCTGYGTGGIYNGDGSTCATVAGHCVTAPVLHNNGPIITGSTTLTGISYAPAGSWISEGPQEDLQCASTTAGVNGSVTFRLADDFTVPAGKQWAINKLSVYPYVSGGNTLSTTVTNVNVQIWNGPPNVSGSAVVWGDTTTNRLASATWSNAYRVFNTSVGAAAPTNTRPPFKLDLNVVTTLPAGTYWIDYQVAGVNTFNPMVSVMTNLSDGVMRLPAANALQFVATPPAPNTGPGAWQYSAENGNQTGCLGAMHELPFILEGVESNAGGGPVCYPNCDSSTVNPCLNVGDFSCFLNAFANGASYANCDNSTTPPVLNVGDFSCFLNAFASGCSACI